MTILIVDNLIGQLVAMKKVIQEVVPEDCKFIEADNFDDAVAIVKDFEPIDLAVVDFKLTADGTEGLDVIRTIRREPHRQDMRTILITAYPGDQSNAMAEEVGADRFICKLDSSVTEMFQSMVTELLGI